MRVQLRAIIVDADAANAEEMRLFLEEQGVRVEHTIDRVERLPSLLRADAPPLVIVNLDPEPAGALRMLAPLLKATPAVDFFVMSSRPDPHLLMEAMHLGIKEFISLPMEEDRLRRGLDRVAAEHADAGHARLINFVPTVGGCGTTTIACNIAAALSRRGRALLVDLDLSCGAAAASFDVAARFTIADLMAASSGIDLQLVRNVLAVHQPTKLSILARPEMLEDAAKVTADGVSKLFAAVAGEFDYVVVDSTMDLTAVNGTVARLADVNVLVVQPTVPSVRNAERYLAAIRRMGVDADRMRVIVNRLPKRGADIEPADIEKALGLKIACALPNDFKNAIDAINFGAPVLLRTPRAELSARLGALAEMLNGRAGH